MLSLQLFCAALLLSSAMAAQVPGDLGRRNSNKDNNSLASAGKGQAANKEKAGNARAGAAAVGNDQGQRQSKQGDQVRGKQGDQDQGNQDIKAQNSQNGQDETAQDNNNQTNQATNSAGQNVVDSTTLSANAIQSGSFFDGQQALGAEDFQAPSLTSKNNFINNCAGKTLTSGLQIIEGSCNGITMGEIPAKAKMVSSIILFPQHMQDIPAGQDFNISVQMTNIQAGTFTNPVSTYYSAPQQLNKQGIIIGHTHVTVQDLGKSLNPEVPPDPTQFAFFKGINDAGNGKGLLQATVAGGLPAGNFRVCTMAAATNHQPVIMPVAQRGSQDDCTKFTVGGGAGNGQQAQRRHV